MWKGYLSLLKYQTALPQFFPELDETTGWEGWKPVQQVSAQPLEFRDKYLQGDYPEEFWNIVSNNPEDTRGHGGSKHRVDEEGNYLMVGVRGDEPVGDLPTRGPFRPRKGRKGYPQDYGVRVTRKKDMPSRRNIVVKPMNVKKEAKSPKALAHKRKYETEYESSPARKKYRRELERERRKRGVAGKGGGDMSHTKTGKIVVEDPHTNRARSHPSVGSTLKMVKIVKDENDGHGYACRFCNSGRIAQYNAWFNEPRCMECIEQRVDELMPSLDEMNRQVNQPQFDSNFQDINTGEPMEITMQLLKTEFAPPSEQGDNPAASTLFDPKTGKVGRSVVHGQPGMNPEEATRQVIHEDMHRATLPEVGLENMGHAEFPAFLGEELYLQQLAQGFPDKEGRPTKKPNPHRKRDPHTLESSDPITQALYRTGKHSDVPKEQQKEYIRAYAERSNPRTLKMVVVKAPRIPRKKGQPANSKKHSDLYTDENPKGTIHGLGFKNPAKARQSVVKIKNSSRSHAHKTQAAIAMEQRAKEMGKKKEAGVYRNFIESQKKKTKQLKKAFPAKFAGNCRECGTYLPVGEMVNMGRDGGIVCRDAPRCGMKYVV